MNAAAREDSNLPEFSSRPRDCDLVDGHGDPFPVLEADTQPSGLVLEVALDVVALGIEIAHVEHDGRAAIGERLVEDLPLQALRGVAAQGGYGDPVARRPGLDLGRQGRLLVQHPQLHRLLLGAIPAVDLGEPDDGIGRAGEAERTMDRAGRVRQRREGACSPSSAVSSLRYL
jgi:hypothetical protein